MQGERWVREGVALPCGQKGPDNEVDLRRQEDAQGTFYRCYGCSLSDWLRNPYFKDTSEALCHLHGHILAGHKVPEAAIGRLEQERDREAAIKTGGA